MIINLSNQLKYNLNVMRNAVFDTEIKTNRLLLRRLSLSDVNDMFEYTSNPVVTKHLHWQPHKDISVTKKFIFEVMDKYEVTDTEFFSRMDLV